jgi:hypothetical protein
VVVDPGYSFYSILLPESDYFVGPVSFCDIDRRYLIWFFPVVVFWLTCGVF